MRCHCVGVRRTSWPAASVTCLLTRSMRKSGVSTVAAAGSSERAGPAERGPEPGEQLLHVERLGHVVIGAGVEGLDLLGVLVAGRQHDHRDRRPPPQSANHLDAVDSRKAEVDDGGIVMAGRGPRHAPPRPSRPGRRHSRGPAGAPRGHATATSRRRQPGSGSSRRSSRQRAGRRRAGRSPPAARSVATGRLMTIVRPPPGVSSMAISPPIASTNPLATASPRPTPMSLSVSPRRWNGRKSRSRAASGTPGPRSTTLQVDPPGDLAGLDPNRRAVRAVADGVVDDVGDGPLQQGGVDVDPRQGLGDVDDDLPARRRQAGERRRNDLVEPDRSECQVERAGPQAAHVQKVVDQLAEPLAPPGRWPRSTRACPARTDGRRAPATRWSRPGSRRAVCADRGSPRRATPCAARSPAPAPCEVAGLPTKPVDRQHGLADTRRGPRPAGGLPPPASRRS